jgi:hypothetical protein
MGFDLRVHDVPPATLLAFLEATAVHPGQDLTSVSSFAGFSPSTGRKALPTLEALRLVERDGHGCYTTAVSGLRRGTSMDQGVVALRRALLGYRPFEAFCEGLALGESPTTAARKAGLLLGIGTGAEEKFDVLARLGRSLGILESTGTALTFAAEFTPVAEGDTIVVTPADVESEAKARLFNARWLGRSVHNALDELDRQLLCEALLKFRDDPRKSVESSGQALEDFLREIAMTNGLAAEAKKANGAGQLGTLLGSKGLIHAHHQKLVDAVSTARNARSHRKDKRTMAPWTITDHGALSTFTTTLTTIRSIGEYTINGRQTI